MRGSEEELEEAQVTEVMRAQAAKGFCAHCDEPKRDKGKGRSKGSGKGKGERSKG